jgi:hypothetical protein
VAGGSVQHVLEACMLHTAAAAAAACGH